MATGAYTQETVVQTFDDLPFQPIDDLYHRGVTFDYKLNGLDSDDAKFASFGPVATEHVTDPSVVGNSAGILTITFDVPTPSIAFGLALSTSGAVASAVNVALYDELNQLLATQSADSTASQVANGFSDLLFEYQGAPVSRMSLDFADAPRNFALDNLTYIVPEPNACIALAIAIAALTVNQRRRKR
jgi:hypothetical protein